MFPNEGGNGGTGQTNLSFYTMILPLVEQNNLYESITGGTGTTLNPGSAVGISTFLCPSRRTTIVGAKCDYAGIYDDSIQHLGSSGDGDLDYVLGAAGVANLKTILNNANVTLSIIDTGAGSSQTVMLCHKLVMPPNYDNTNGPNDFGWVYVSNAPPAGALGNFDHMAGPIPIQTVRHPSTTTATSSMGTCLLTIITPAARMGTGPVLWADGSVRMYPYYYATNGWTDDATWQAMWCWNRNFTMAPP